MKTMNLSLSWADARVTHAGAVELTVCGSTEGGKAHKIVLTMGPSSIGYMAEPLHKALKEYQAELDAARTMLRGPT